MIFGSHETDSIFFYLSLHFISAHVYNGWTHLHRRRFRKHKTFPFRHLERQRPRYIKTDSVTKGLCSLIYLHVGVHESCKFKWICAMLISLIMLNAWCRLTSSSYLRRRVTTGTGAVVLGCHSSLLLSSQSIPLFCCQITVSHNALIHCTRITCAQVLTATQTAVALMTCRCGVVTRAVT